MNGNRRGDVRNAATDAAPEVDGGLQVQVQALKEMVQVTAKRASSHHVFGQLHLNHTTVQKPKLVRSNSRQEHEPLPTSIHRKPFTLALKASTSDLSTRLFVLAS